MKKVHYLSVLSLTALTIMSCGGSKKSDENQAAQQNDPKNALNALSNMAGGNTAVAGNDAYQEKLKERRAKGDTLAMPYADLQKFLPQSLDGYKADKPDGATINMAKMSYSSASLRFSKDNGDWVKVSIIDYNQAYSLFTAATALWAMGVSVDSPEEKAEGVKLDNNVAGWEDFKKNTNEAAITLGVGSRFLLAVEANNQTDVEMVKTVAKSIDLSKLSSM